MGDDLILKGLTGWVEWLIQWMDYSSLSSWESTVMGVLSKVAMGCIEGDS